MKAYAIQWNELERSKSFKAHIAGMLLEDLDWSSDPKRIFYFKLIWFIKRTDIMLI